MGSLPAYLTWGTPHAERAVLVCHSFSADQRAGDSPSGPGWWRALIGPGLAVDTRSWYVVASAVPATTRITDVLEAQDRLRQHLGIDRWHLVVGGSLGGLQALNWALGRPERVNRVVAIAAAHRLAPSGHRHFQQHADAIAADLHRGGDGRAALGAAWDASHGFSGGPASRLQPAGNPTIDAATYATRAELLLGTDLVQTWGDGDLERAAARVGASVLLLGYRDDQVFSANAQRLLAAAIRRQGGWAQERLLPGNHGHDSFLAEPMTLSPWIASALMPGPWHLPGRRCRPGPTARAA